MRRKRYCAGPADADDPLAPINQSHDRAQSRRASASVPAQKSNDLATLQCKRHAMENVGFAVPGMKIVDLEGARRLLDRGHRLASPARVRDPR
mgnify:CR=1 FL=1